jgi:hypothetical protein
MYIIVKLKKQPGYCCYIVGNFVRHIFLTQWPGIVNAIIGKLVVTFTGSLQLFPAMVDRFCSGYYALVK